MQSQAKVVIVGGGMMGVGLLYHLALEGWTDVVLVEKGELTSGSTWHAAGQCPSFIADYNMAKVHHHSNTLYSQLEEMTGHPTGWHGCGGIRFALTQEELDYFKLVESVSRNIGYRMQVISPEEIRRINPFVKTDGVLAGAWTLDDGHVDPASCCNAMAVAAKNLGATIVKYNRVLGIKQMANGEFEVETEQGNITCEHVVNAGGCYADRISAWLGVKTQFTNMLHQYVVTEPIPEFLDRPDEEIPVMRDPYPSAYYRQEQMSGLIGIYERADTEVAWADKPGRYQEWTAENELFPANYEPIMPWLERVMERMPIFAEAGILKVVNGAISHTIDSNPLVGPAPGVKNFWLATGSSIGIAQGAGCGKYLAQWMVHGAAEINMVGLDPRRFGDYADQAYTDAKAHREYWDMYDLVLPGEERPEGRPARATSLFEKLQAKGAVHTESFGWERPKWFSLDGREEEYGFRRNNVFEVVREECKAVRERVGVFELPSFSKFMVTGADAGKLLDRVTANRISKKDGGIVLTHGLGRNGRIEAEFTITRLAEDRYYCLSGATAQLRDGDLLNFAIEEGEDVTVKDITLEKSVVIVAGPHARDVLSKLTETDLTNANFRWLTGQEISIAGIDLIALRVNYVGELGWELHVPIDKAVDLYDTIWAAGEAFGIADFGTYAMNSLRLEKAYAGWGVELTNEITPVEAKLDRFVKLDKDFVGKDAVLRAKDGDDVGIAIVYVEVDAGDTDVAGGEAVMLGDEVIGVTTSGGYGHHVGKSLAFAYVNNGHDAPGSTFDIEILGERRQATVLSKPVYDPKNERLRV
ncbi:MAG: FAD-dependent oxidoreductase [Chloroflexota bacterium]